MVTYIFDPICDSSWVANTLTWLWGKIQWEDDRRKSTERFWKETWKLKDAKQLTEWEKSCNILFGMKPTSSEMNLSYMPNYKGSVDFMFEKQKPTQFFLPTGTFSVSIPIKVPGLHASYRFMHPKGKRDQLELQYEGLEHWLFKLKLPLSLTERPTIVFSVTPNYEAFSLPCEIKLEGNLDKRIPDCRIANWSIGLTSDASIFSFAFKITKSTASCKAKIHGLSASADWDGEDLKCSFEQEVEKFSITSKCQINVKDAKKNVCSVGVGKRWDDDEKGLHRGIQVVFDTHDVTTITYSRSLTKKLSLGLSATVDVRVINNSRLGANFSFT